LRPPICIKAEAEEMRIELETQSVQTFKQAQRNQDIRFLEQLQCQKVLVEEALVRNPTNTLLKEKLRRITDLIKKLRR